MVSLNISHIMFHLANLMLATSAIMHLKNSSVRFRIFSANDINMTIKTGQSNTKRDLDKYE